MASLLGDELHAWQAINGTTDQGSGGIDISYSGTVGTAADSGEGGDTAYDFPGGSGNHIETDSTILLSIAGSWTLSWWIKFDDLDAVMMFGSSTVDYIYLFDTNLQDFRFRVDSNNSAQNVWGSITAGQWYHMIITCDASSRIRWYVDNVQEMAKTSTGTTFNFLRIGCHTATSGLALNGRMDDIRIWDHVITSGERTTISASRPAAPKGGVRSLIGPGGLIGAQGGLIGGY